MKSKRIQDRTFVDGWGIDSTIFHYKRPSNEHDVMYHHMLARDRYVVFSTFGWNDEQVRHAGDVMALGGLDGQRRKVVSYKDRMILRGHKAHTMKARYHRTKYRVIIYDDNYGLGMDWATMNNRMFSTLASAKKFALGQAGDKPGYEIHIVVNQYNQNCSTSGAVMVGWVVGKGDIEWGRRRW